MSRKTFWRWMIPGLALPVAAAVLTAWDGCISWIWSIIIPCFGLPILAIALLAVLVGLARWKAYREPFAKASAALLAMSLVVMLLLPAGIAGIVIGEWRIDRAMSGVGPTVAALDSFRSEKGRYPASFEEAEEAGTPIPQPWFAATYEYTGYGTSFRLSLYNPYAFLQEWIYTAESREWQRTD